MSGNDAILVFMIDGLAIVGAFVLLSAFFLSLSLLRYIYILWQKES